MKILIDNGHGVTSANSSPDRKLIEGVYTREIAAAIVAHLQYRDLDAELLVPESDDIPLPERVRRVNAICDQFGARNVILVSIHVDAAASDGQWHWAEGWSCYTSRGQTAGDLLADCLCKAARDHLDGHELRFDYTDGDPDKEADFYILRHTRCAAVLTENGFQDNRKSVQYLLSDEGKKTLVALHVEAILLYLSYQSI